MDSIWSESVQLPVFEELRQNIKTDVLIVGGGMAGLLCGYMLKKAGIGAVITEAARIGGGITQNTTAKVTLQHGLLYSRLLKKFGQEKAQMYLQANSAALEEYKKICRFIDCDFEGKDSFVYSLQNRAVLEEEIAALDALHFKAEYVPRLPLPIQTAGAVKIKEQAQFHPLKFIAAVSEKLQIYENTRVLEIEGHTARTEKYTITADEIIVTTHFPCFNLHGSYFLKMYQDRSYVIALENGPDVNGMYVDEASGGLSFRNYKEFLFLGGGAHRTGKAGCAWRELRRFAARYYPRAREKFAWAAQDCMTLDGIPYIGNYSKNTPHVFVATGFQKWGMTSSMTAAMLLRDRLCGIQNPCAEVFSPSRSMLTPQLAVNAWEAAAGLLRPSKKRCTHMGCALKWNSAEHTWDCSCHGSRFSRDGGLIDNPAKKDLKAKE